MKLVRPYRSLKLLGHHHLSIRIFASMFSSEILTRQVTTETLMYRVRKVLDPKASIYPILDEWNAQVHSITRTQGLKVAVGMKKSKRFIHALQIFEWMDDHCNTSASELEVAIRINVICMAQGVDHAENYFDNLPPNLKGHSSYGALLSSFAVKKSLTKAEGFFTEMKNLGLVTTPFPYNMMIILYGKTGNLRKIDDIISEMEKARIPLRPSTLKDYMSACVAKSSMVFMERVIERIRRDPTLGSWDAYTVAARGYINAGSNEFAVTVLTYAEYYLPKIERQLAINYLIYLYARAGSRKDVVRVWDQYRKEIVKDSVYVTAVSSFVMVGDFDGAEEVFWEWDGKCVREDPYDFRVLEPIITGYCRKGGFATAESILSKAAGGGITSYVGCWEVLACEYAEAKDMGKAVEMMKKGMEVGRRWWKPSLLILKRCLAYLATIEDKKQLEEFKGLIQKSQADS